jgi:hypothetical protein
MRGVIPPLPQYVFMAWCLVKHRDFTLSLLPLSLIHRKYFSIMANNAKFIRLGPNITRMHVLLFVGVKLGFSPLQKYTLRES